MTTGGYIQKYATDPDGPVALARGDVLNAVTLSAFTWALFTLFAGAISDRIGRRATYLIGFIAQALGAAALFPLVNTGDLKLLYLALTSLTFWPGPDLRRPVRHVCRAFPGIHPRHGRFHHLRPRLGPRRSFRPDDCGFPGRSNGHHLRGIRLSSHGFAGWPRVHLHPP